MFSGEINDRKERKKVENISKQNVALVPKIAVVRKEEGATAAASHLPPSAGSFVCRLSGRTGSKQRLIQTIGKASLNTQNVLNTVRNAGDF